MFSSQRGAHTRARAGVPFGLSALRFGTRRSAEAPTLQLLEFKEAPTGHSIAPVMSEWEMEQGMKKSFGSVGSMGTSVEMFTRGLTKFARCLAPGVLIAGVALLGPSCAAQDIDVPTRDAGQARGSVVAPSGWAVVDVPVKKQIDLKFYGFYIGGLNTPVAQVDVPIRATKFLIVTPSYMSYSVPASGLNKLPPQSGNFTGSYSENQFRIDATVPFNIRKLEISARNMYVRRFRPSPADDINRYRGRISLAYPVAIRHQTWKPFASYESFYDQRAGWNRNRVWTGVTLPLMRGVALQPSYMWESSTGNRDVHYLLLGLIVRTRSAFIHQ
jgi:hypothetical protein